MRPDDAVGRAGGAGTAGGDDADGLTGTLLPVGGTERLRLGDLLEATSAVGAELALLSHRPGVAAAREVLRGLIS